MHKSGLMVPAHGPAVYLMQSSEYLPNAGMAPKDSAWQLTERKPRALVVDDAPDIVHIFEVILRHAGYDVVTKLSAPAALKAAQSERFDVVVSDIGMPGMNGYDLAEALRALPDYGGVPMVAVTGFAKYEDRNLALASGFDAHLMKPVVPTVLIELIKRLRQTPG